VRRPAAFGDAVPLKPDEFRMLRDLFIARTGLHFGPESTFSLERRLRERLKLLKLASFSEYHHYLRFGAHAAEEWDQAIDLLTTNETYFFREERQLRAFRTEVLPLLHAQARSRRRLVVWSAGCATGEEAYTIAILVHMSRLFPTDNTTDDRRGPADPFGRAAERWDVRVYGSDISRRCVAAARRGVYGSSSFRATEPEFRNAFFQERQRATGGATGSATGSVGAAPSPNGYGTGSWSVVEPIRRLCHFGQTNLLDHERLRVLGKADAIFCRNVLIYFDARARRAAIEMLYERLVPGGILLLGHSESLLNVSTAFELLHLKDDLVYRKPVSARDAGNLASEDSPANAPAPAPAAATAPAATAPPTGPPTPGRPSPPT
jgi:chemotaxis protein methyltransferase CheR